MARPGVLDHEEDVGSLGVQGAAGDDAGAFEGVVGDAVIRQERDEALGEP